VETIPAVAYVAPAAQGKTGIYVSPQIEALLGYSPQEWSGDAQFWRRCVHPDDADTAWEEFLRGRTSDQPFSSEFRMIRRDGGVVWVRNEFVLIRDSDGEPWVLQGALSDITALKEVEHTLRQALEREREAAAHVEALDAMKNDFLSAV